MSDQFSTADGDAYLGRMRKARKGPAVLKSRLVSLRSTLPKTLVFAFEGNDDKIVYHHWISRIRPGLQYEPFPCDGKTYVLQLKEMIDRDLGGLGEGVYFFIDRDFDDLRGRAVSPDLFMTDTYSVENYLVSEGVLEEVLKNEFHCHAEPAFRHDVIQLFKKVHKEFLAVTREINYRLFVARRLKIELTAHLPDKISHLATLTVDSAVGGARLAAEMVRTKREATPEECSELEAEFSKLDPGKRYRGKFSLLFFLKWLEYLASDRNDENPKYFPAIENGSKVHYQSLTLGSFASKSDLPMGLSDFILKALPPV